jgi:hypothetical protein
MFSLNSPRRSELTSDQRVRLAHPDSQIGCQSALTSQLRQPRIIDHAGTIVKGNIARSRPAKSAPHEPRGTSFTFEANHNNTRNEAEAQALPSHRTRRGPESGGGGATPAPRHLAGFVRLRRRCRTSDFGHRTRRKGMGYYDALRMLGARTGSTERRFRCSRWEFVPRRSANGFSSRQPCQTS